MHGCDFIWFPMISYDFGWFLWFLMSSCDFLWFPIHTGTHPRESLQASFSSHARRKALGASLASGALFDAASPSLCRRSIHDNDDWPSPLSGTQMNSTKALHTIRTRYNVMSASTPCKLWDVPSSARYARSRRIYCNEESREDPWTEKGYS